MFTHHFPVITLLANKTSFLILLLRGDKNIEHNYIHFTDKETESQGG